jgi:hypothetical protein
MSEKQIIKQDINFLEYPLWAPRERDQQKIYKMTDVDGYNFESSGGVPSKVDMMILYFILLESQNQQYKRKITLSKYKILSGCNIQPTKERKERLKKSLERWKRVIVSFSGKFYTGIHYSDMEFGIIETWKIAKDKPNSVEITFNEEWLQKIQHSNFFKYISFNEMLHLRSPIAIRLYEILSKTFYKRNTWEISSSKLAKKIPLSAAYHSKIVEKIKPAVKIINEKTSLNIKMTVKKTKKNDGVFTFQKVSKSLSQLMKDNQEIDGIVQAKSFDADGLLKKFTADEIEIHKKKYISDELPKNKYLTKIYNSKGFNKVVELSFLAFLSSSNKED